MKITRALVLKNLSEDRVQMNTKIRTVYLYFTIAHSNLKLISTNIEVLFVSQINFHFPRVLSLTKVIVIIYHCIIVIQTEFLFVYRPYCTCSLFQDFCFLLILPNYCYWYFFLCLCLENISWNLNSCSWFLMEVFDAMCQRQMSLDVASVLCLP
jgi:hypothetical protein